ncbi:nucleoporin NUP188-like [Littorina saxatilis]|uniref:Nucleoporin NUP188 n=1 Tax=Littorina saxatilis TaxID=31220 RepID=A0AAN9G4Z1_9CAEN
MAGQSTPIDSFSNRVLWQFISGSGVLRPKELIEHELNKNKARLLTGLLHYKPPSGTPGERLKKERKVSGRQLEFVLKLSKFLSVDELLCHDLFCAFLVNDYRGSRKSLKQVLSHERHSQALILKIRDFYFTERLYLLRCLRHIFLFWDLHHPYREVYAKLMKSLQDNGENLLDKVQKQLSSLCQMRPPDDQQNGMQMTNVQVLTWVTQNLKEQCELLEMVLILNRESEMKPNTLLAFVDLFKSHGFGIRQTYKHHIDGSTEKYIKRISYLEVMIVVEAMDVEQAMLCWSKRSFADYHLSKKEDFQAVNSKLTALGSDPVHSPVLLGWSMVRHFYLAEGANNKDTVETHKMGNRALQLAVFRVLLDVVSTESFTGTSHLAALSHYLVYKLLYAVLSVFQEDTLGNPTVLYEICNRLLRQPAVAQDVWQKDDGLWLLYESAMAYFPLDFSRFMTMTVALATATPNSAAMVKKTLKELSIYTEYLDNNSAHDLQPTKDPSVFMLTVDKRPYPDGDFALAKGSCGQVLEPSALPRNMAADVAGPLMRWETQYNGWSLLLAEVMELLRQVTQGAGMVETEQVERVTMVMELVHHVLKAETAATVEEFAPFVSLSYDLVHRFSILNPAPLDLLSEAVNCIACAAKHFPGQVWHKVMQTGLLPYLTENVDDLGEVLSGQGLHAGMLGSIEAGTECVQARYPLTLTVLNMLTNLVQAFSKAGTEEELQACLLHILKEIFPLFRKWRYTDLSHRKQIGQQCLTLFHKVLNLASLQNKKSQSKPKSTRPSLHEVCVYSLLFTEAGRALIEIVATGVDNVEMALVQQGSLTEGSGVDLIELIQLSLSVLNRLLLLRSPDLPLSPVEQALSWQPAGRQSQHVVATVAQYIYHRHNPKLPTLATLLLKRLAMMSPMSILACLGNDAEPIRDMFLTRLQALSEDLRLKVAILELLSVCVETQPGLIEMFFDVQLAQSDSAEGKKGLQLGRSSCLQTLLTLMEVQKQTTYHCPPDLLCASLDLVHSLWRGRRETAMEVLRSKQSFWASVTAPLKRDITEPVMETAVQLQPTEVKIAAFSFRILAQEVYAVEGARVDPQLKACLQDLGKSSRLTYWSQFVRDRLLAEAGNDAVSERELSDNPTILLLKAWRNFLLVISRSKVMDDLQLNDGRKEQVMAHLLEGLQAQFSGQLSLVNMKLAAIVTALYYTLLKSWGSCVGKPAAILVGLRGTVEQTVSSSETLIPPVQIGLVASLALVLQRARLDSAAALTQPAISTLLTVTCSMLLQSIRQLSPPARLAQNKMDTASGESGKDKADKAAESKLMLQLTICSLLTEIVMATDVQTWLPRLQEHGVMAALLVSLEAYIKAKQGMPYVHTALLLLAAIADTEKGAAMLSLSDFTSHTCLSLTHLYTNEDIFTTPVITPKVSGAVTQTNTNWHSLYCLAVNLYTLMLRKLGFSFLEDALNFLGSHQDRLQQSLELARLTLLEAAMTEAEATCNFLHQMALYRRQWRLHLPQTLMRLLSSLLNMTQTFVSLLIRPRYLQHILERGRDSGDKGKHSLQSSPLLQHQTSTDDVDQPSSQLIATEISMLRVIGKCLAVLRHFSPDLCQVLLDQSMDMCEYEPLIDLGFSTPSVDQESPLTFGSLVSCVTACLRRLQKEHKSPSPHRVSSPHRKSPRPPVSTEPQIPKALLQFVMENCLTLAMTQACRYLREPSLPPRDKQFLKRELSTELNSFLTSLLRHVRRGSTPGSPGDKTLLASPHAGGGAATTTTTATTTSATGTAVSHTLNRSLSQTTFSISHDQHFFKLVQEFVKKVLR